MKSIDLIKRVKKEVFSDLLKKAEIEWGGDLKEGSFNLVEMRGIIYSTCENIAEEVFREEFRK